MIISHIGSDLLRVAVISLMKLFLET